MAKLPISLTMMMVSNVRCTQRYTQRYNGMVVVNTMEDNEMDGGYGPDLKSRGRYYSLFADRNYKRVFMEDEGDLYLRVKGE